MLKKQKKEVENLLDKLITSQTILDECEKKIGGFNEFVKMLRREIDETIRNTQLSLKNQLASNWELFLTLNFEEEI